LKHFALSLATAMASLLTGCAMLQGHLYPIQGPLSVQTPPPIFTISMGRVTTSGTLSASLQNGELFKGNWSEIKPDDPSGSRRAFGL
jgi:hypothetical protein